MNIPLCFSTRHHINHKVVTAFAKGCGGQIIYEPKGEFIASYGLKRGTIEAYKQSKSFIYIDKGYYFPSNHPNDFSGYYRVCFNSLIHSGKGDYKNHKFRPKFNQFNVQLQPWVKGKNIILCPILTVPAQFYGIDVDEWTKTTYNKIREYTDKPIIVSTKSNGINAKNLFKDAHVLVTFNSNIMVDAIIAGVPIISLSPDRPIGSIEEIENPIYESEFLMILANMQWTLEEMRSGQCWRELNEMY